MLYVFTPQSAFLFNIKKFINHVNHVISMPIIYKVQIYILDQFLITVFQIYNTEYEVNTLAEKGWRMNFGPVNLF
jgi:hypothetical protein